MAAFEKNTWEEKRNEWDGNSGEQIERRQSTAEEVTELSAIEGTAASRAAWLISVTVYMGGFLFGYAVSIHDSSSAFVTNERVGMTQDTYRRCW